MKRKVVNIVVRNPADILDSIQGYETLQFSPIEEGQTHFEDLVGQEIKDVEKTELYINGVRYTHDKYNLVDNNILKWSGDFILSITDVIVFVWRL